MESSATPVPPPPGDPTSGTAREIRHAVYLTGGLVLLALGIPEVADGLGAFLGCAVQVGYCPNGFSNGFLVETTPALIGAGLLIVIAIVLLLMARNVTRRG